ncbi:MAG: hypothetical protein ACK6AD_02905 [Cyanobacteriota bacterium]
MRDLPLIHRDSLDRLPVVQANQERLSLLSANRTLPDHGSGMRRPGGARHGTAGPGEAQSADGVEAGWRQPDDSSVATVL